MLIKVATIIFKQTKLFIHSCEIYIACATIAYINILYSLKRQIEQ